MVTYFLDTYALMEIINGNPNYAKYVNEKIATSVFNLYELYYNALKIVTTEEAREYFRKFKDILISFNDKNIFDAAEFRHKNRKMKLSYTDALGYIIAISNDMKFVTGDKEFKILPEVEFSK